MKNLLCLLLFISCICFFAINTSAQKRGKELIDSLVTELPKCPEDTNKVLLLNRISRAYVSVNTDEGLKYGQQGLELSKKLKWAKGSALVYNAIGRNYYEILDYKHAEEAFRHSMKMHEKAKNPQGIANSYVNIGSMYYDQNRYADALEQNFKAVEIFSQLGYREGVEIGLCNIGVVYLDVGDSLRALPVISHAIKVCKVVGFKLDESINLNNRSIIYREQGRYQEAKRDCRNAMSLAKGINNSYSQILAYKNLGVIALKEKDYSSAQYLFNESLKLARDIKSSHRIEVATGYLGRNYMEAAKDTSFGEKGMGGLLPGGKKFNLDTAIALLKEAIRMAEENHELNYKISYYYWLSEAYELSGDTKNAALNKKYSRDLENSLYSDVHMKRISKIAAKYEPVLLEVYKLY